MRSTRRNLEARVRRLEREAGLPAGPQSGDIAARLRAAEKAAGLPVTPSKTPEALQARLSELEAQMPADGEGVQSQPQGD